MLEKKMEITSLDFSIYCGYTGIVEHNMQIKI